ncbi:MAG: hypothetical protein ACE5H1_03480, partial [Thermodesulfobacteriota bacterium]
RTTVEKGSESQTTGEVEFIGVFLVAKNDKGGFDVHNFGLMPSLLVEDGKNISWHKISKKYLLGNIHYY